MPSLKSEPCATTNAARDPLPLWANDDPNDLLRFIFASPRPCEALDRVLELA